MQLLALQPPAGYGAFSQERLAERPVSPRRATRQIRVPSLEEHLEPLEREEFHPDQDLAEGLGPAEVVLPRERTLQVGLGDHLALDREPTQEHLRGGEDLPFVPIVRRSGRGRHRNLDRGVATRTGFPLPGPDGPRGDVLAAVAGESDHRRAPWGGELPPLHSSGPRRSARQGVFSSKIARTPSKNRVKGEVSGSW